MAKWLTTLWDRAQGKWHVERICNRVFDECLENGNESLKAEKLHVATLMVYNSVNKQLLSPHKEPPSMETIERKVAEYQRSKVETRIDRKEFQRLIMEWISKDLKVVLANRAVLAFAAAPALAVATKRATKDVPYIGNAVEKVPTPLLFSLFSVGLVLLQDLRVS